MSVFLSIHPANPQLRLVRRAIEVVRDGGVAAFPTDSTYAIGTFCRELGPLGRGAYRAIFPIVGRIMKSSMSIDEDNAAVARETTREAFDFVAKEPGAAGYLVGDHLVVVAPAAGRRWDHALAALRH